MNEFIIQHFQIDNKENFNKEQINRVKEELGINLEPLKGTLFSRTSRRGDNGHTWFEDVWVFEYNESLESIAFDESEVCEVMWSTTDKIREMMITGEFLGKEIYPYFDELMEKWGSGAE